jgi:hypothetical protein
MAEIFDRVFGCRLKLFMCLILNSEFFSLVVSFQSSPTDPLASARGALKTHGTASEQEKCQSGRQTVFLTVC